ncbi:hypothetical protein CCH79_00014698 [Gambusia affinis]|uniref:Uncharacterized protein n=1 Tax=Gambusia affinis TaxID=33528 RepID=A0A315UXP6_GAMAF|nr:hypothetical protein CCH79_00014698 [Gambusia affinis]
MEERWGRERTGERSSLFCSEERLQGIVASFPGSVSIRGVLEGTDDVMVAEKEDVMKPVRSGTTLEWQSSRSPGYLILLVNMERYTLPLNSTSVPAQLPYNATVYINASFKPFSVFDGCDMYIEAILFDLTFQTINVIVGIPANLLVIAILIHNRKEPSTSDLFLGCLAFMDAYFGSMTPLSFLNLYLWQSKEMVGGLPNFEKVFTGEILAAFTWMVVCNASILWVLKKSRGVGKDEMHPMKKKAFKMVLSILCIIVFNYLPLVALFPFEDHYTPDVFRCYVQPVGYAFLNISSTIQPLVYLSRLEKHQPLAPSSPQSRAVTHRLRRGGITWLQVTAAWRVPVSPGGVPAPVLSDDELEAPQAALGPSTTYTTGLRDAEPPVQELTSCRLEVMVPSPPLLNLPPRSKRSGSKHSPGLATYLNYFYSNIDGLERKISTMIRRP